SCTATTNISTLSLHDALPIWPAAGLRRHQGGRARGRGRQVPGRDEQGDAPAAAHRRYPLRIRRQSRRLQGLRREARSRLEGPLMSTDYTNLIDAETWAFIERTNAYYPPDTIDYTILQQREIYDRMCREFHAGYPDGMTATDSTIATPTHAIPIRIYRSATPDQRA